MKNKLMQHVAVEQLFTWVRMSATGNGDALPFFINWHHGLKGKKLCLFEHIYSAKSTDAEGVKNSLFQRRRRNF